MSDDPDRIVAAIMKVGDGFRSEIGQLRGEIGQMRGEIGQMRGEIGQMREDLHGEMATMRAAIMDRIDRLQDTLTTTGASVSVSIEAANLARRANESIRQDIAAAFEMMAAMERQIRLLDSQVQALRDGH